MPRRSQRYQGTAVGTSTEERIARSLLYPSRAWAERYGERSRSAEWRCHQAEICRRHAFECLTKSQVSPLRSAHRGCFRQVRNREAKRDSRLEPVDIVRRHQPKPVIPGLGSCCCCRRRHAVTTENRAGETNTIRVRKRRK